MSDSLEKRMKITIDIDILREKATVDTEVTGFQLDPECDSREENYAVLMQNKIQQDIKYLREIIWGHEPTEPLRFGTLIG